MKKEKCRYCETKLGEPFLQLGHQPLANAFIKRGEVVREEFVSPLDVVVCNHCQLMQLTHTVPPEKMFAHYLYVSSTTATFRQHFVAYAKEMKKRLHPVGKDPLVAVDIGSNDGLLVSCYLREGMKAVGIEPAKNLSEEANQHRIPTIHRHFDAISAQAVLERYGKADLISANNVFAHVDDVKGFCQNVIHLLKDTGIFVIEFPYLLTMLEEMLFDMIYHEHLSYIAIDPLKKLLESHDLKIFDIDMVSSHGGSCRVFVQKRDGPYPISEMVDQMIKMERVKGLGTPQVYANFAERVLKVKDDFGHFLDQALQEDKTVSGYGAPAKANTLINFCGLTSAQIRYIVDDNPLKQNTLTPGAKIPIYSSDYLKNHPTDYVVLFAWNFAREIIQKMGYLKEKGVQFFAPLPSPRMV